jgi:hypothetical protein
VADGRTGEGTIGSVRAVAVVLLALALLCAGLGAIASPADAARKRTVESELRRLAAAGDITAEDRAARVATWRDAVGTWRVLRGTRRSELGGVLANTRQMAARGDLTASRLPAVFLIVARNREWWASRPLLGYGQRVSFPGSQLVWEHYPGQGIQIQMLASFGKANGLWSTKRNDAQFRQLIDELLGLAAGRAGGIGFEYYFHFDRGSPPWVSSISQGTAVQALARAGERLGDPAYFGAAHRALAIFQTAPPGGVRVRTSVGAHYLIYSFAPKYRVANAFAQSLVGLYDDATLAGDATARELFDQGDAQARQELPRFDTGAWSYYSPGKESDLSYHTLLRGFLSALCQRTNESTYCDLADRFTADLTEPPTLSLVTKRARGARAGLLRFRLNKISRVGITVAREGKPVFATSAVVGRGLRGYAWRAPARAGDYDVTLLATDLAGNQARETGTLQVLAPKRKPKRRG